MPDIDPTTQIGADGQRHPAGTQPTDADDYRRGTALVLFNSDAFFDANEILDDGAMVYTFDTTQMWVGNGTDTVDDLTPL